MYISVNLLASRKLKYPHNLWLRIFIPEQVCESQKNDLTVLLILCARMPIPLSLVLVVDVCSPGDHHCMSERVKYWCSLWIRMRQPEWTDCLVRFADRHLRYSTNPNHPPNWWVPRQNVVCPHGVILYTNEEECVCIHNKTFISEKPRHTQLHGMGFCRIHLDDTKRWVEGKWMATWTLPGGMVTLSHAMPRGARIKE